MVTVTIELPAQLEEEMKAASHDLAREVKEAYALELYRQEKISHFELSKILGLDRFQTSALLQHHKIYVGALTMEDLEADYQTVKEMFEKTS